MNDFHNPYNFIPAANRDTTHPHVGDHHPAGHDRLHPDRWTGTIDITLTTTTPLLIPDNGTQDPDTKHWTYGTRQINGRVDLPATTIKGALRSAYEAITNSRMGVFTHYDPIGYRSAARSSLGLTPVLVRLNPDGTPDHVVRCAQVRSDSHPEALPAVALPSYSLGSREPLTVPDGTRPNAPDRNDPQQGGPQEDDAEQNGSDIVHGQGIAVWAELVRRAPRSNQQEYYYWRAIKAWRWGHDTDPVRPSSLGDTNRSTDDHEVLGPWALIRGMAHRTNRNTEGKHDERLFPLDVGPVSAGVTGTKIQTVPMTAEATADLWAKYRLLLDDYVDQHTTGRRDEIWDKRKPHAPWETYPSATPPVRTVYAWSRHLYSTTNPSQGPDFTTPDSWVTCYAEFNEQAICALYPVLISRRLHSLPPSDLVPDAVEPAPSLDSASPADRVFGWVRQTRKGQEPDSQAAVQGAMRIGPVSGPTVQESLEIFHGTGLRLDILSSPKPSQGRFYVGQVSNGLSAPVPENTDKGATYVDGNMLRGRKVYPHQPKSEPRYWTKAQQRQEYRRPRNTADDQNRSILSWVKPGMTFSTTVHLRSLSDVELGALLVLLNPDAYGCDGRPGLHRMGGGKPFGFGSVRITVDSTDLRTGDQWLTDFVTLDDPEPRGVDLAALIDCFTGALSAQGTAVLDAARRAAVGFTDDTPVHYPREHSDKGRDGKNYRWFTANEKGRKRPLPALGTALPFPPMNQKKWKK